MNALEYQVYVLVGSEPVQRRYLLQRLREQAGSWERMSVAKCSMTEILQSSLLADPENPLVRVLEDYSSLKSAERKELAAGLKLLAAGLNLIICVDRLGAKDPLRLAIPKEAIVSVSTPKRGQFVSWLMRQGRLSGISLEESAAIELVERIGENTEALAAELTRLGCLVKVTNDLVIRLTPHSAGSQAWGWVDALAARQPATKQLADCEASGLEPLMMLGALSKRLCMIAWTEVANQKSAQANDYPWKLAVRAAGKWPQLELRQALLNVAACQQQLKGQSRLTGYTLLARLDQQLSSLRDKQLAEA